ncbi:MAG: NADPH-dependent FMN reductase, partial [Burkholderiaceae bacterium]|nr:NADPH-dependent FMN reductase [Burkholderiaceae bacterium]
MKEKVRVRKGQAPDTLSRAEFRVRFFNKFKDPAFSAESSALERIEVIAWDGYTHSRKAPLSRPAGRGYADPSYDLADEWRAARQAIRAA